MSQKLTHDEFRASAAYPEAPAKVAAVKKGLAKARKGQAAKGATPAAASFGSIHRRGILHPAFQLPPELLRKSGYLARYASAQARMVEAKERLRGDIKLDKDLRGLTIDDEDQALVA